MLLSLLPVRWGKEVAELFCMLVGVTAQKNMEEKLIELSTTDGLTRLSNRVRFEQRMRELDETGVRPVGIIICDIDGLKTVSDCLGHERGDELLCTAANTLKDSFPTGEAFRISGDGFAILLPGVDPKAAEKTRESLSATIGRLNKEWILLPFSISIGTGFTTTPHKSVREAYREADDAMYHDKLSANGERCFPEAGHILERLFEAHPYIKAYATHVAKLAESLGRAVGLAADEMSKLLLLAKFHDIEKVALRPHLLRKETPLTPDEAEELKRHCEVGYRIARRSPEPNPIAELILQHHEWWNGKGYPNGLKGKKIHIYSRIVAVADAWDNIVSGKYRTRPLSREEALTELKNSAGTRFDPQIVATALSLFPVVDQVFAPK
ncbi:bifunctional diguanylate cyclase/phosphohydrolase [Thermodesulfitimonas sp.]